MRLQLKKKTLTKNGYQMTLSKMKCKRHDPEQSEATFANLLTTMTLPQNQKLIISSFLNVLQPLSENHSGQLHREKDSDTVHGNLIDTLKTSLSKYRALLPTEAIFTLRQILHKCHTYKVPTHHLFINLKNSYATINREQLWKMVHQSYRWPADVIESLKTTSDFMNPNSHIGVQHGNPLSQLLLAIALDVVIRKAMIDSSGTIFMDNLQFICYADDIDLIARDFSHLERAYTKLKREAIKVGLILAFKDSKYMYAQPKSKTKQMTKVTLDHDEFEVEKKCEFLDSTITYDNDLMKEIDRRITIGNTFQELLDSTLKTLDKEIIYKTQIRPQVLYGHESWVLTKSSVSLKKLKDFECEVLRSIYGKLRTCDGKSYEAMYSDMVQRIAELDIEHTINIGRLRWAGHVLRMPEDCPARIALESNPNVKLPRGHPPAQWIDCVEQDLRNVKRYTNWRNAAQDTELWNQLLDTAKSKWMQRKVRKCRFRIKQDSESSP
ncbi:uncharacterized protein LOC110678537 isoform X2 [Aedes aegypti]|uniref:Reverse transcriptase domain-containing protein n=1 Tax=Aedes aegypti TaxID=7159 RepID=A0A6I8U5X7_AEDAE|nr:uncharacterized protein LOC110678537 isoform X2 [Aedes aegypti]